MSPCRARDLTRNRALQGRLERTGTYVPGGETGPDLTRSTLVAEDFRGDKIAPLLRSGRVDKGMPAFDLNEADTNARPFTKTTRSDATGMSSPRMVRRMAIARIATASSPYRVANGRASTRTSPRKSVVVVWSIGRGTAEVQSLSGGEAHWVPLSALSPPRAT